MNSLKSFKHIRQILVTLMAVALLDRPDAAAVLIVAMTANAFTEDVRASLDAGMNAHVAKPLDVDQLWATLRRVLGL